MQYFALILVSSITLSSTIFAVQQGWLNNSEDFSRNVEAIEYVEYIEDAFIPSPFEELAKPIYLNPKKVILEGKNLEKVELFVEEVGLQIDGQLDVPSLWSTVGWYKKSAKSGEKGNIIIDGHYDTDIGSPAAFWGLKSLAVNDRVTLIDALDRSFIYEVVDTFYVDIQDPARTEVFEDSNEFELTLITCGGVWDAAQGTYNKRLVVKALLVS